MYGTCTGLNLWVDIMKYFTSTFSPELPLTQQIDEMSELQSCIESAGMPIADSLHAMLILRALLATYEIMQQMILANVSGYKTLKSADMRSCLLSEELRQGTTTSVNAFRTGKKTGKDTNCNHCGGSNHWEKECCHKQCGLSREEVQSK